MKIVLFLIVLLSFACSSENKSYNKSEKNTCFTYEIPRYKVSNTLYPMLSEIIYDTKQCKYSTYNKICFFITLKKYRNYVSFLITDGEFDDILPSSKIGFFIFSNKTFIIDIPQNTDKIFFLPTKDKIMVKFKNRDNEDDFFPYPDDSELFWRYRYESGHIQLIQKFICKQNPTSQ